MKSKKRTMDKRTPEKFLAEEGMTIATARRIYANISRFINNNQHTGCWSGISTTMLVQEIITNGTNHAGSTSARQFLMDIGEDRDHIDFNLTDTEHCDHVGCCYREECSLYQNTIEEEAMNEEYL